MANDIIARLRINGEQFSADSKGIFSAFSQDAAASGQQAKSAFESSFSQITSIAKTALQMPRLSTGALDLNVGSYEEAAAALRNEAVAAREVATAVRLAADSAQDYSQQARLSVAASEAAAVAKEREAAAATTQATAVKQIQAQLGVSQAAALADAAANDVLTKKTGNTTAAKMLLQHSVRSTADSFAAGLPPMMIFGEQIGRVGEAAALAGGTFGAIGEFLAGPWGIALTAGVAIATPFIAKLFESKDAAGQAADALKALEDEQRSLASVIDQTNGKISQQNLLLAKASSLKAPQAVSESNRTTTSYVKQGFDAANQTVSNFAVTGERAFKAMLGLDTITRGQAVGATDLSQAIKDANGNLGTLTVTVNRLADSNPALAPLRDQLNGFYSSAVKSNDATKQMLGAQRDVNTALAGGTVLTRDVVAAQIQLATANDAGSKASARLAAAQAKLNDLFSQPSSDGRDKAIQVAKDDVIAAQKAVDAINSAPKTRRPRQIADPTSSINSLMNEAQRDIGQYGSAPTFLSKANEELQKLQQGLAKLDTIKPRNPVDTANIEKARDLLNQAANTIRDNLNKPFDDYLKKEDRSLELLQLQLNGRDVEAAALQKSFDLLDAQGRISQQQLATVYDRAAQEERISRALEDQRKEIGLYVNAVGTVQSTVNQFLTDLGSKPGTAFKGIITGLVSDFRSLQTNLISNTLFAGIDQKITDLVKGKSPIQIQADQLTAQSKAVGDAFADLVDKTRAAAQAMGGVFAANDNPASAFGLSNAPDKLSVADLSSFIDPAFGGTKNDSTDQTGQEIVVTARKVVSALDRNSAGILGVTGAFREIGRDFATNLEKVTGIKIPEALKNGLGNFLQGASLGTLAGGAFASITGGKQSTLGSALGGGLGKVAGESLSKSIGGTLTDTFGSKIGGLLGKSIPFVGSALGGVLGNVIGGLFQKKIVGAATINTNADGTFSTTNSGNSQKANQAATSEANAVITSIQQVAQQLGAQITGASGITVGTYKGNYRVNTQGTKLGGSSSPVAGLTDFGDDQQAAIAYAVQAAISKGVISGISQASIKILQSGQDLSTAIQKALLIEQVPKDLKALVDPVGAAIDQLNEKFNQTVAALKEGGATADQMAQAQQLYNLELDQVKASTASASQTLKDFLKTLNIGSSSPLSLRDQESSAKAALQPFLDSIAGGKTIDQSGYQTAAQAYLDIERQLYGSTQQYFAAFDKIQAATAVAISKVDNVSSIASPADASSPFPSQTATATQTTATNTQTANEILAQQTDLLNEIKAILSGASGTSTAAASRLFTANSAA